MGDPNKSLVEGIDYYVEEGRWVFTAAYHAKRGSCCKSGCRHCPYGNSPLDHLPNTEDRPPRLLEERCRLK